MSETTVLSVRLRTTDLVAQSTGELLHRVHPSPEELAGVDRRTVWICAWSETAADIAPALAALTRPGVLHNPNKEALRVAEALSDIVCPVNANDAVVVTWPLDHEAEVTVRGILRRAGCDAAVLRAAWCATVWGLRAAPGAPSQRAFADSIATVRGRGQGVLANPHLATAAVVARAVAAEDLVTLVSTAADAASSPPATEGAVA